MGVFGATLKIRVFSISLLNISSLQYPSCANRFVTDLVLGRACLSNVKVVLQHVSGRADLHASVLGYKLVT